MWLLTNIGFFSIIERPEDIHLQRVTIRARVRSDLEALQKLYLTDMGHIHETTDTDYRFRARAFKRDLAKAMAALVDGISYPNFKDEVYEVQGRKRAALYADVWTTLYQLQSHPETFERATNEVIHRIAVPRRQNHCAIVLDPSRRVLVRMDSREDSPTLFFHISACSLPHPQDDLLLHLYQLTGNRAKTAAKCLIPAQQGYADWVSYTIQVDELSDLPEYEMSPYRWVPFDQVMGQIELVTSKRARKRDKDHFNVAATRVLLAMFN
jgi:hypothetical protein